MALAISLTVSLVVLTFLFHYTVLRWLSGGMSRFVISPSVRILVIVLVALSAHFIEIALYALAYALGDRILALGGFGGLGITDTLGYFYFSIVSYTSLGLGDVFPSGHLRFIAGVEALNGLLLIAWSGSFIYIAMGKLWPWQPCAEAAYPAADGHKGDSALRI
ncbi:MAG: potassium channel family protein [Hyphomonas sp.]|nr:potassium channel family protein [Hyphomonas sp.]